MYHKGAPLKTYPEIMRQKERISANCGTIVYMFGKIP